jgi:hypothetical protein
MKNQQVFAALAMDLHRVAMGYHRGSVKMAERFLTEAMKRKQEVDIAGVRPYLRNYLNKIEVQTNEPPQELAEDFLTYSILFQNAATALS